MQLSHQYTRKALNPLQLTTAPYPSFLLFPKFRNEWSTTDYTPTSNNTYQHINLVFGNAMALSFNSPGLTMRYPLTGTLDITSRPAFSTSVRPLTECGTPGLLKKLSHYGVEAEAHIWLTGYLSGRRQRVQVDGTVSPWLGVPAGVPQGSVLGLLLFLTYTIDLPNACINDDTTCSQFADDTALIASTSSPQQTEQQLQRAVTSAAKWLNDWHLLVNIDKTVTMTFYHDNRPPTHLPTIFLNDSPLKTVRQQRHLGVIFQHNLQWSTHVNNIINKSLKVLHMLTKLRNSLNSSALSYLYCTYIRPILEYACIAVTPLPHNILDRLERIQRKAARICLHLPLFSPVDHSSLLHRLQLPTLFSRRRIKQLLLSHSIFHHYAPPHLLQLQLPPLAALMFTPFAAHVHIIFQLPALIASKTPQYSERFTISIRSLTL